MDYHDFFDDSLSPKWDAIMEIDDFKKMETCKHSAKYHKEGSPLDHTKKVVQYTAELIREGSFCGIDYPFSPDSEYAHDLMLAALFHDIGKASTTVYDKTKMDWSAPFHSDVGAKLTRLYLFDREFSHREHVVSLVRNHMILHHILESSSIEKKLCRFYEHPQGVPSHFLLVNHMFLSFCDSLASENDMETFFSKANKIQKIYSLFNSPVGSTGFVFNNKDMNLVRHLMYGENRNKAMYDLTVYVLIGAPGSGKTTYIKENLSDRFPVVSRDIIREEKGFCKPGEKFLGDKQQEDSVTSEFNRRITELAAAKKDFVVDNTNMKKEYRDALHNMLKEYKVYYVYIYVEAPSLEENMDRRKAEFGRNVEAIIRKMYGNFDFPSGYEYNSLIIVKQKGRKKGNEEDGVQVGEM